MWCTPPGCPRRRPRREAIIAVDLVGVALVLEEFGQVIAAGGSGVVIASQAGHMISPLPAEQHQALATTPADELPALPFLQPDVVTSSGAAYALAKRANIVRVQAASVQWGDRGARLNSISPGIIMTPLALDELNSGAGEGYQRMIKASAAGRVGTPDEIGATAAFLMGRDGTFIPAPTSSSTAASSPPSPPAATNSPWAADGRLGPARLAVRSNELRQPQNLSERRITR